MHLDAVVKKLCLEHGVMKQMESEKEVAPLKGYFAPFLVEAKCYSHMGATRAVEEALPAAAGWRSALVSGSAGSEPRGDPGRRGASDGVF